MNRIVNTNKKDNMFMVALTALTILSVMALTETYQSDLNSDE